VGYNGYSPNSDTIMKAGGHATHSVYNVRNGIFTRGILMDIPRLKGVPYLEPGTRIYPEDLPHHKSEISPTSSSTGSPTGTWECNSSTTPISTPSATRPPR
jgi:hypothetical protein